jgi:hypothetical protein
MLAVGHISRFNGRRRKRHTQQWFATEEFGAHTAVESLNAAGGGWRPELGQQTLPLSV